MADTKLVICEKCLGTGHVNGGNENSAWSKTCEDCHGIGFFRVPMTNADRIRAMSVEELARLFVSAVSDGCPPEHDWDCKKDEEGWDACDCCWAMWLRQPVEEDTNGMQELS